MTRSSSPSPWARASFGLAVLVGIVSSGCGPGKVYVIPDDLAAQMNDKDWTVKSAPRPPVVAETPAPDAPPAPAAAASSTAPVVPVATETPASGDAQ